MHNEKAESRQRSARGKSDNGSAQQPVDQSRKTADSERSASAPRSVDPIILPSPLLDPSCDRFDSNSEWPYYITRHPTGNDSRVDGGVGRLYNCRTAEIKRKDDV
jgi:hypothetical protein